MKMSLKFKTLHSRQENRRSFCLNVVSFKRQADACEKIDPSEIRFLEHMMIRSFAEIS